MPVTESHGDRFRELMDGARMPRIEAARRLALEIKYPDHAKLVASVDSYRAGNRPSIERAAAWDRIFGTGNELVTMWWGVSRPAADEDQIERLQEKVDELEARLEQSVREADNRFRRLESALGILHGQTP